MLRITYYIGAVFASLLIWSILGGKSRQVVVSRRWSRPLSAVSDGGVISEQSTPSSGIQRQSSSSGRPVSELHIPIGRATGGKITGNRSSSAPSAARRRTTPDPRGNSRRARGDKNRSVASSVFNRRLEGGCALITNGLTRIFTPRQDSDCVYFR